MSNWWCFVKEMFVKEIFCSGDILLRRCFVKETFCLETFCRGDVLSGDGLHVRRTYKHT
jgi:hypothetical protein